MKKKGKVLYIIAAEVILILLLMVSLLYQRRNKEDSIDTTSETVETNFYQMKEESNTEEAKKFIKWVEFNVTYSALEKAYRYDVETHSKEVELHWIELLAYLGAKYGGDFTKYKEKDMMKVAEALLERRETIESLTKDMKFYDYYIEAYTAVLGGLVGDYEIQVSKEEAEKSEETFNLNLYEDVVTPSVTIESTPTVTPTVKEETKEEKVWVKRYGIKAFSPIAKGYYYYDYNDFGVSRTYGYKRRHLGHDMMGEVGTPIIAVESGYIEALGWNQYGGWRIGIRSFDGKRYYYYAHLRKNFPYNKSLEVGSVVTAGDVIGYLGRTGYSKTENTNNIETAHLHFGLQLIFDESQKEGNNEIWIDLYGLTKFLYRNRVETVKNLETKEYSRIYEFRDPAVEEYVQMKK